MRSVALLLFGIHLALTEKHSMEYFGTVMYRNKNFSEVTAVGMIDDEVIMHFDNITKKVVPKTEWIKKSTGAEYWNRNTEQALAILKQYEDTLHNIMDLFNHLDVHIFQIMFGCELEDGGTTQGYLKFGYDGEDFISFDKKTLSYKAYNPQADIIKKKWDTDRAKARYWKTYLDNRCIERLRNFVKSRPERKVAPEVSLLQKNSSSPVICHATGFYPKNITMTWKKNNEDHYEDVEVKETLPNADGTFQKSISLSVKSEEWKKNPDVYRCGIQHVGAEKEIVVLLNENNIKSNSASDNIIVICLVFVSVTVTVVLALIIFAIQRKRKSSDVKSPNSTDSMQNSNNEATDPL